MVEILYKEWCKGGVVAAQSGKVCSEPQLPQATGAPASYTDMTRALRKTKMEAIKNSEDAHSKDQSWCEKNSSEASTRIRGDDKDSHDAEQVRPAEPPVRQECWEVAKVDLSRARKSTPDPNKVQTEFSPWQSH
ncbi:hypothetical protein KM043_012380 [Ampulex compressa]|nr:hypothetical protein KM043_012380 [Ampulex compressa]